MNLFVPFAALSLRAGPQFINPGEIWPDDRGKHIQAHGGGVLQLRDTYYWFGEDRSPDNKPNLRYVACYSSKDLVHWKFRNQVVKADDPAHLGPGWVLERPKVYFNAKNLLNTPLRFYEGNSSFPVQREFYDVTYEAGVRVQF